jgi:hypothetical protein
LAPGQGGPLAPENRVVRADGAIVQMEVLRPNDWLEAHGLVAGKTISFSMPEMDFAG